MNVWQVLKPLTTLAKCHGLTTHELRGVMAFKKVSIQLRCYNVLVILLGVCGHAIVAYYSWTKPLFTNDTYNNFIIGVDVSQRFSAALLLVSGWFALQRNYGQLCDVLSRLDALQRKTSLNIDVRKLHPVLLLLCFNYSFAVGLNVVDFLADTFNESKELTLLEHGALSLLFLYLDTIVIVFIMLHITFIQIVRVFYGKFNDALLEGGLAETKKLQHGDNFLKNVAEQINSIFDFNFFFFSTVFLMFVYRIPVIIREQDLNRIIRHCSWFLFSFLQLMNLVWVSVVTVREAEQTANHLHELFIENDDPEIREEVEIFSLQLLHRKVDFNACGFFKLDFSLLYSMVGAVTTYIIILVQFQQAQDNNKLCSNCTCTTTTSPTTTLLPPY